jgi:hypothetical protein
MLDQGVSVWGIHGGNTGEAERLFLQLSHRACDRSSSQPFRNRDSHA